MKLRTRTFLLPSLAAVMFLVGMGATLYFTTRASGAIAELESVATPYLDATNRLEAAFRSVVASVAGAVAEGNRNRLDDAGSEAAGVTHEIERIAAIAGKAEIASQLAGSFQAYSGASLHAARLLLGVEQGDGADAVAKMQPLQAAFEALLASAQKDAAQTLAAALAQGRGGLSASIWADVAVGLLITVMLFLGSWWLVTGIRTELGGEPEQARAHVQRIASGDLSRDIALTARDAHSLLGAVQEMSSELRRMIGRVSGGAEVIATASMQIARGNQDLSQRTEQQAGNLERATSSMEDFTNSIHENERSARRATEVAAGASVSASRGGEVVGNVVRTMESISESSRRIAEIIGVIDGIAFQTNILALNAAVEAARAGEQGRGFAVVASEVRNLAQRSATAAREIKGLIEDSVSRVDHGSRLADEAGKAMVEIASSVGAVTTIIEEILQATSSQGSGIEQVNLAVNELHHMTQQNAALVEQGAAAAESLQEQAGMLADTVRVFRLAEH